MSDQAFLFSPKRREPNKLSVAGALLVSGLDILSLAANRPSNVRYGKLNTLLFKGEQS